jgi:hypothetical protein
MWYLSFFLAVTFIGLAAVAAALIRWRRASADSPGWHGGRQGLATLCVLAAGAGLAAGAQFKLAKWYPVLRSYPQGLPPGPEGVGFLSLRVAAFLVGCLALLAIGAALLVLGGPPGGRRALLGHGPFAAAVAVALIFVLAELSVFQNKKYVQAGFIESIPPRKLVAIDDRVTQHPTPRSRVYQNRYQFSQKTECYFQLSSIPVWSKALQCYKGKPGVNYLEVGIFEGRSLLWMLENVLTHPTARVTGIDPFADPFYTRKSSAYKETFYSNLKASGSEEKARIIEGYSQTELRKLPVESFDIIYIDGSHDAADVLEDAILSWRLLKDGGLLILDDYRLHSGMEKAIDTFYYFFSERFEPIHVDWQVFLRKRPAEGSSVRPWRLPKATGNAPRRMIPGRSAVGLRGLSGGRSSLSF